MISKDVFSDFFHNNSYYEHYKRAVTKYPLDKNHLHFLSQIAHESNYLRFIKESYNYSAERILKVFPKYFKNKKEATKYEGNYELLNKVYANRMGNGDEASGDGFKYRGRGFIQLTGFNNYKKYGLENCPDKLLEPELSWEVAILFFKNNDCHTFIGDSYEVCKEITKKINGGYNGLEDRFKKFQTLEKLNISY